MSDNRVTQQSVTPNKVGVFISYNRADLPIATALRTILISLSSDLDPFIDHIGLKTGDEYEEKLAESIRASQWFIMVCSGPPRLEKNMAWCWYEAGQFRSKLQNEGSENLMQSRFVVLHDDERPSQLAKFQSAQISLRDRNGHLLDVKAERLEEDASILFESTSAYTFLEDLLRESRPQPLRDLTDPNVRSLLRTSTRTLIRAFITMRSEDKLPEVVFHPRISFRLPPATDTSKLSPDTLVTGEVASLGQIFGIVGTETTWGRVKGRCRDEDGNDALWVGEIEAAAEQASIDQIPNQPEGLCVGKSDGKFYRVLFARYEPFRSGARICYIVFIPRKTRLFDVRQRTSILLGALILSIRFRQKILPFFTKLQELPRRQKRNGLLELERELLEVETESQEYGLRVPKDEDEEPPVVRVFRDGENKTFVAQSTQLWQVSRRALAAAFASTRNADPNVELIQAEVEAADVAVRELQNIQKVNGKFVRVLTEELLFVEKISSDQ